jgi:hypothetical protein
MSITFLLYVKQGRNYLQSALTRMHQQKLYLRPISPTFLSLQTKPRYCHISFARIRSSFELICLESVNHITYRYVFVK